MYNLPHMAFHDTTAGRRVACAAGLLGGALLLSGCVVAPTDGYHTGVYDSPGYYSSSTVVYTQYGSPPPPRVEYRTVAPGPGYAWVGGDWVWGGSRYDWRPGRWVPPHGRAPEWRDRNPHQPPPRIDNRPHRPAPGANPPQMRPPERGRPDEPRPDMRPQNPRPDVQRPAPPPRDREIRPPQAPRQLPSGREAPRSPENWGR